MSQILSFVPPAPAERSPLAGGSPTPDPGPETARPAGCPGCGHPTMRHGLAGCYVLVPVEIDGATQRLACPCDRTAAELARCACPDRKSGIHRNACSLMRDPQIAEADAFARLGGGR